MKKRYALAAIIVAQVLSGINTPLIHYAVAHMSPYMYGLLRVGITMAIIVPLNLVLRRRRPAKKRIIARKDALLVAVSAIAIYGVANLLFYIGIRQTTSLNAAIISLLWPVLFFIANVEVLKERFSTRTFAGIGLAFTGTALAVLAPIAGTAGTTPHNMVGTLLIILSAVVDIGGTLMVKKALKRVHVLDLMSIGLVVSFVFYAIIAAPFYGQLTMLADPAVRNAILYGGIVVGCITYSLGYLGLAATKGGEYGIVSYLQPIAAMIMAVVFFHENFTPALVLATIAVFVGLYLVEARRIRGHHLHGVHR